MARRPARFCGEPRCPAKVRPPHKYCTDHRSIYTRRRLGPTPAFRIYDSPRWRYLRETVKREEPICRRCQLSPTTDVDHIQELEDGGAPYDRANLQGLCHPCHGKKTSECARARRSRRSA